MDRAREIETFKTEIDLRVFAASLGYQLDRSSGPNSPVMVDSAGDKIVIGRARDGHWIYFSVRDERDCGSIIDFAQNRGLGSLGEVRKALRPFIGASPSPPLRDAFTELQPVERDIVAVRARFAAMEPLTGSHPYLTEDRRIPAAVLTAARFSGRLRTDARGNVIFPHFDREGLCGYELVNTGFKGFAKSGAKGLWASNLGKRDHTLVFAESAIDALSYAALHGYTQTRFYSLAGQVSPDQLELAGHAMRKLTCGIVVLAFDNDRAGDRLLAKFENVFEEVGRSDLGLRVERSDSRGTDWNDRLRAQANPPLPTGPEA